MYYRRAVLATIILALALASGYEAKADDPGDPHDWNEDVKVDLSDFAVLQRYNGYAPKDPNDPNTPEPNNPILGVFDYDGEGESDGEIDDYDFLGFCYTADDNGGEGAMPPSCHNGTVIYPDDPNDDEYWPPCDGGPDDVGDGLFLRLTTGDIWTQVPIFKTYSAGEVDLEFWLRYDSIRNDYDRPAGYGWRHNFDIYLETVASYQGEPTAIVFLEGHGRRNLFRKVNGVWEAPPGRAMTLTFMTSPVDHFELTKKNGTKYIFNENGCVSQIIDRRGRTTTIEYNANGYQSKIISPHGRVATLEYDAQNQLIVINHPDGRLDTDPEKEHTELTPSYGAIVKITDPEGGEIEYGYETYGMRLNREKLKNGVEYTVEYVSQSYPSWEHSRTIKDSNNNIVARVNTPRGRYFPDSRCEQMGSGWLYYRDGNNTCWIVCRDNLGRLKEIRKCGGGESWLRKYGDQFSGNNHNRIVETVNEKGDSKTYYWDGNGNLGSLTDEEGHRTNYEYNNANFPGFVTDRIEPGPVGERDEWEYVYNATGDLTEVIDPIDENETDPNVADATVTYAYTTYGNREVHPAPSDPNFPDLPGRIKEVTRTDRNGKETLFEYDGYGNLVSVTRDPNGLSLTTEYDYDAAGRRTNKYIHRDATHIVETEWQYDSLGRITDVIHDPNNEVITTSYTYDGEGFVETITNPNGHVTRYGYDHRSRLTRIFHNCPSQSA